MLSQLSYIPRDTLYVRLTIIRHRTHPVKRIPRSPNRLTQQKGETNLASRSTYSLLPVVLWFLSRLWS